MLRSLTIAAGVAAAAGQMFPTDFGTLKPCKATDMNPVFCSDFGGMYGQCAKWNIDSQCGTGWTKQPLKHCAQNRFPMSYSTKAAAQAACDGEGASKCQGIYDVSCNDKGSWYLCKPGPLSTSGSSCVYKSQSAATIACCASADCSDQSTAEVKCSTNTAAGYTPPVTWAKASNSHCASFKIPSEYHPSLKDAQMACDSYGARCTGVYDPSCNNVGTFYLCDGDQRALNMGWSTSSSSCIYQKPAAATTAAPASPTPAPTPATPAYVADLSDPTCSPAQTAGKYVCGGINRYGCDTQLIESYCGRNGAGKLEACCGDVDGSCTDGDDDVYCNKPAATPAPTPAMAKVVVAATIKGWDAASFSKIPLGWSVSPATAFRIAFAAKASAPLGRVVLSNFADASLRRLGDGDDQRKLAANGLTFDVTVTLDSTSAASTVETNIKATSDADLLTEMSVAAAAPSGNPFSAFSATVTKAVPAAPVTMAPYYQPPAPTPPTPAPGSYTPSATVKRLHGYMVKSGGVTEGVWDPKKTSDGVVKVTTVAAAGGAAMVALFLFWFFCHACAAHGPCKRCYKRSAKCGHLNPTKLCRAKMIQTVIFVIFGGLMFATVKGRDSFHQATDIISLTLKDTAATFDSIQTSATEMQAQSGLFQTGFTDLTKCSTTQCDACRYGGQAGTTKATWEKAARDALVGPNKEADGGYAKDIGKYLAQFRDGAKLLLSRVSGSATQLTLVSVIVGEDGKKYVDMLLLAMLVPGILVLLLGLLGTWLLTKNTGGWCSLSTLPLLMAQLLGLIYVVMLVVFIAVGAGTSVLFAETCNQPVPETALIEVLQQDNMATGKPILKPEDFDVPTLNYYLTCAGTNQLEDQVKLATAGVAEMEKQLGNANDCDTAAMAAVVPAASKSVGTVAAAVTCPNINFLLTRFTREGICTHMVDGLYFLWTVQAACGVFLLLALAMLRITMATAYAAETTKEKAAKAMGTPVAAGALQITQKQENTV